MSALKTLAREWLPPAVLRWITPGRRADENRFVGEFATWDEANAHCTGYDAGDILAKVLAATLKVKNGEAAYERDSVLFDKVDYSWPVISGLMWAARNGGRLSVLDFGGALGSCFFQNRTLLQTLREVRWNVVEQAHYVTAGRAQIQDEQLRFYPTIEECLAENQPNVILLSSVLSYLPAMNSILQKLIQVGADAILIDKTIVNRSAFDRLYVQHVPASIYAASYPCRSLSESALIAALRSDYLLLSDFPSLPFPALKSIDSEFKGFIFLRQSS